jgi:hypothetical protein
MTFQLTELNPGDTGVLPHQVDESDRLEDDIAQLQGILAGATSLSQSTLLLQKRKDMKQVDALLAKTKAECVCAAGWVGMLCIVALLGYLWPLRGCTCDGSWPTLQGLGFPVSDGEVGNRT